MVIDPEQHEVAALLAQLPAAKTSRVLEIGCGDGAVTEPRSCGYFLDMFQNTVTGATMVPSILLLSANGW